MFLYFEYHYIVHVCLWQRDMQLKQAEEAEEECSNIIKVRDSFC